VHLLLRAFYALRETLTPAFIVVGAAIVAVGSAAWFSRSLGVFALPLGYGLGAVSGTLLLGAFLLRKISLLDHK
jgi:peptidoglycan biosynthesis protein MviN/MurJ (putative lipid II flippase)